MDVIPPLGGGIQLLGWNSPTPTLLPLLTPMDPIGSRLLRLKIDNYFSWGFETAFPHSSRK